MPNTDQETPLYTSDFRSFRCFCEVLSPNALAAIWCSLMPSGIFDREKKIAFQVLAGDIGEDAARELCYLEETRR